MIGVQRVLVVEDSATSRKIITRYLEELGFQIDSTTNGVDALAALRTAATSDHPYTTVVTDLFLPGLDGYGLARLIRRDQSLADIRLILLTAFDEQGRDVEAKDLGFDAYLTKPVDRVVLQHAVLMPRLAADTPAEAPFEPVQVLVAEDSPLLQKLILLQLRKLGYSADVVSDGRAVLAAIEAKRYELVLMDCQMPELDGLATTREIRRREQMSDAPDRSQLTHLPIVALTASLSDEDRADYLQAGMDDCLAKPVGLRELQTVIQRWLHPEPSAPVNYSVLKKLRKLEMTDSPDLLDQLIDLYLQETPATLTAIQMAIADEKPQALRQLAHRLKGSSLNFGAKDVASICAELEKIGKMGTIVGAAELYEKLTDAYECVRTALIREQKLPV